LLTTSPVSQKVLMILAEDNSELKVMEEWANRESEILQDRPGRYDGHVNHYRTPPPQTA
jgi:hypothetical protein